MPVVNLFNAFNCVTENTLGDIRPDVCAGH
jgi:hypothetical protein